MGVPQSRLAGVQAARGIAALLVVLYHAGRLIALPQYVGFIPLGAFFNFGHAGVDFFFVLSGFIIFFVHNGDIGRPQRLARYAWRRVSRIYPVYWSLSVPAVLIGIAAQRHGWASGITLSNVLLFPVPDVAPIGLSWTLRHEMLFYSLFALAILNARLGVAAFGAWAVFVLANAVWPFAPWPLWIAGSTYNLDFIVGAASAFAVLRRPPRRALLMAGLGGLGFLATGLSENAGLIDTAGGMSRLLFALCSGVAVLGVATAERQGRLRVGRVLPALGEISYPLYLVHGMTIALSARLLMNLGVVQAMPGALVMLLVTVISLLAGTVAHLLVEAPVAARQGAVFRWLSQRLGQPRARPAVAED